MCWWWPQRCVAPPGCVAVPGRGTPRLGYSPSPRVRPEMSCATARSSSRVSPTTGGSAQAPHLEERRTEGDRRRVRLARRGHVVVLVADLDAVARVHRIRVLLVEQSDHRVDGAVHLPLDGLAGTRLLAGALADLLDGRRRALAPSDGERVRPTGGLD